MLYALYGTDTKRSRGKVNDLITSLLRKKKDASLVRMTNENFSPRELLDLAKTQGLFESKTIVVLDMLFENKTDKEIVLENIKNFATSENIFILLEEKLDAKAKTKIKKYAEKVQEFELPKQAGKREEFNIFELSDALGVRDRKKLWVLYQLGKIHNVSDEEMHGILFWATKNMLLAKKAKSAKEAMLSPFVYQKAKKYSSNFEKAELESISSGLVSLYHDARRGKSPFDTSLEIFLLSLS